VNFAEQMQSIFDQYLESRGGEPVSLDDVAEWAVGERLFFPEPRSVVKLCRDALAESLRVQKRVDEQGREYRAKISIREQVGGAQLTLWADLDTAPKSFVRKAFAQRRRAIIDDCYQLKQAVDHYNADRGKEDPVQMVLNFEEDVAELEAAREHQPKRGGGK
jgi:hypothetical protein